MKKKILIDTSYLLHLFGIDVKLNSLSRNDITKFLKEGLPGYNIYISDISLLEVLYKLNSEYRKSEQEDILDRYEKIIPTVFNIPNLTIIQSKIDPTTINYANIVRKQNHTDYLDCLISGTALKLDAVFITEDSTLQKILDNISIFENLRISTLFKFLNQLDGSQ